MTGNGNTVLVVCRATLQRDITIKLEQKTVFSKILKLLIFIEVLELNSLVLFILNKQKQDTCSLYTPTPLIHSRNCGYGMDITGSAFRCFAQTGNFLPTQEIYKTKSVSDANV